MVTALRFRLGLLAIVLLWLSLRIIYWNGYYTEDAPGYVTDAIWLALGNYHARSNVNGLNVGTYLPVALPIWIMGKSEVALSLWPMACSLLGLLSIAGAAGNLFGRPFALLGALLYATYPGDVFFSTVVMPDALQAGWLSFSMFLIVAANVRPEPPRRWLLAGAGVAMGVCHLVRANDVLLVPVGVCAVAVCSRTWREADLRGAAMAGLAYLTGWAAVLVLEGGAYLWSAHDFLLRLHVVTQHYGTMDSIARAGLNIDPRTIPLSLFAPVTWWTRGGWGHLNQDQAYHGLLFAWAVGLVAIGSLVLALARPRTSRRGQAGFVMALVWLVWPVLYHQLGSQSLTHYVPVHRLSRHFVVYAPGAMMAVVAGCFLASEAMHGITGRVVRMIVAAAGLAILATHFYVNWRGEQMAYEAFHRIKGTYARIRGRLPEGVQALVADPGDLCFFDFWMNPLGSERVRIVPFAAVTSCARMPAGIVLTQSNPGWEGSGAPIIQDTVSRLPCLTHPPDTWRLVYGGYPEKVFEVSSHAPR